MTRTLVSRGTTLDLSRSLAWQLEAIEGAIANCGKKGGLGKMFKATKHAKKLSACKRALCSFAMMVAIRLWAIQMAA